MLLEVSSNLIEGKWPLRSTSYHSVPGDAILLLPHCHLSAMNVSERAGQQACLSTFWHCQSIQRFGRNIFFAAKRTNLWLFTTSQAKISDWRGLGIPYKYQKGETLPSSQTWVDHDGGKENAKHLGLCYVLRVPGTQLTESQRKKIRPESSTKFYFKNFKGSLCDTLYVIQPNIYASKDAVKMEF